MYSCGSHTAQGTYLLIAENIVNVGPVPFPPAGFAQTGVADALFIREAVSPSGKYKGTLYERLDDSSID